jgi:hypothetical protein
MELYYEGKTELLRDTPKCQYFRHKSQMVGPGELTRYSDSLHAERSGDRIPVWVKFSTLGPTLPPVKWESGQFFGGKVAGALR